MIKLDDFKKYKKILEDNISNKAFRSRMMFEAIEDESFEKDIMSFFNTLNNKIDSDKLNEIFESIRTKTIEYYEKSLHEEDISMKINFALRSLAYFYFLESINEHSKISDDFIIEIKNKFPEDYLEIISQIDKAYLSVDTKEKTRMVAEKLDVSDDLFKKYIVLKKWQDSQHHFFNNEYGKYIEKVEREFCNDYSSDGFSMEQVVLRKRLFDSLAKRKVLDLDTCSILSELYIKKYVVKYIGGKMYGLSVLNSKGIKVPFSVVIPNGVEIEKADLEFLKNKFPHYSVRSSADIEDGNKNSFAGMFDSYLNVSYSDLIENINKVKSSINNKRLKEYINANNLDQPHMAVVIQSFSEPTYAGVWIGNSKQSGILEWVQGNGEKLVSGASTPNSEIWINGNCDNALEVNGQAIGKKMLDFQKKVSSEADFEWMILNGELVMLQYRPVTTKVIVNDEYINHEDGFFGIPASPGIAVGECRYLDSPDDEILEDKILLAMMTDPDWLPHLMNSKAAITAYGGFLCHTAIVCRELGIPCVTGIGEETIEILKNQNDEVRINGNNGNITILEKIRKKI